MKRLNPDTGKPFVHGDARADGFLFWGYSNKISKKTGYFYEDWATSERFYENSKNYYIKNKEKILDRNKKYQAANREKIDALNKRWVKNNPEKRRASSLRYAKNNPEKVNAHTAKRRATKLQRTPIWLTQEQLQQIEAVYLLAKELTIATGVLHDVDHIVPLQGMNVSGLHVPWNLRAIPATENRSKSNNHYDG